MLTLPNFDARIEYKTEGSLSENGVARIRGELEKWYDISLPANFDWSKTANGRITRRISKFVHDDHGFNIPKAILENLGNVYDQNYVPPSTYQFEFTRNFNWQSGDFGDRGSCFFGSSNSRHLIRYNGGMAIRFYNQGMGMARCWALNHAEGLLLWNAYGLTLEKISEIIAMWSGKKVYRTVNCRWQNNAVFLNSGGFFMVGDSKPKAILLNWNSLPANYRLPQGSED